MNYYCLVAPSQKEVGGRGYGQIKITNNINWSKTNEKIRQFDENVIKEVSNIEFELRYDARITDIITGIGLDFSLWFVNLNFLKCLQGLNIYPYFLEPAKLFYRDKRLNDYFIFQPAISNFGFEHVDFHNSLFEITNQYTNQKELINFNNEVDYLETYALVRKQFGQIHLLKLSFNSENNYDFFYILRLPIGHVATERLIQNLKGENIKGIGILELGLDPYMKIWDKYS